MGVEYSQSLFLIKKQKSKMTRFILIVLILGDLSCIKRSSKVDFSIETEIIKIALTDSSVSTYIERQTCINSQIVQIDSSSSMSLFQEAQFCKTADCPTSTTIALKIIVDNYKRYDFLNNLKKNNTLHLRDVTHDTTIFCAKNKSNMYVRLYLPVLNQKKNHAIVYVDYICGLCGNGWAILYKKSDKSGWIKVGVIDTWIS